MNTPTAQRNIDTIRAWLDAHNRQDMKAIDYFAEDIEIVEMPTGVEWRTVLHGNGIGSSPALL
jgi:ketosteroid isomerase-like protein